MKLDSCQQHRYRNAATILKGLLLLAKKRALEDQEAVYGIAQIQRVDRIVCGRRCPVDWMLRKLGL